LLTDLKHEGDIGADDYPTNNTDIEPTDNWLCPVKYLSILQAGMWEPGGILALNQAWQIFIGSVQKL